MCPALIDAFALPLTHTSATNIIGVSSSSSSGGGSGSGSTNSSSSSSSSSRSGRGEAIVRSILKGSVPVAPIASTQGQGLVSSDREYNYSSNSSSRYKWQQLQGTSVVGSGGVTVGGLTAIVMIIGNLAVHSSSSSSSQPWESFLLRLLLLLVVQVTNSLVFGPCRVLYSNPIPPLHGIF